MTLSTLQDRLEQAGSASKMLQTPNPPLQNFPYPPVHTNWRDEQLAWKNTAVLFDQSFHMLDFYISGPDTTKLLSYTSINSYATWGVDRAKQWVAVNEDGYVIADGVLFGLSENEVLITGNAVAANWLRYQAEQNNFDVTFHRDERSGTGPVPKRYYRFELEGPNAWKILEKAHGGPIDPIKFFQMGSFTIGDLTVRALNHTMGGVPGDDSTGLELFGPFDEKEKFVEAIVAAGEEFGLLRGGAIAYFSSTIESGWLPLPVPAIFGDELKSYREWVGAYEQENWIPIAGSHRSDDITEYYATPWELGFGRLIRFDHDFIGREALEKLAQTPQREKVWLIWNEDDAKRVVASSFADGDDRAKPLDLPTTWCTYDEIFSADGKLSGLAVMHGYTANLNGWVSIARVDPELAVDGTEVEFVWGDPDGGAASPFVPTHKQTRIRATVSTKPPLS